jgi:hypothetical protein
MDTPGHFPGQRKCFPEQAAVFLGEADGSDLPSAPAPPTVHAPVSFWQKPRPAGWAAKKAPESRAVVALHVEIGRASVFSGAAACHANAKQCLSWAELASDPDNREAFFDLAAIWVSAAARIEHAAWIEKSTAGQEGRPPHNGWPR